MRFTKIVQADSGCPAVSVEQIKIDETTGKIGNYDSTGMAPNYVMARMGKEGLIPADLVNRACNGWGCIKCKSSAEAIEISAKIDALIDAAVLAARQARATRVMQYVEAILSAGKTIYTRNDKGQFTPIE